MRWLGVVLAFALGLLAAPLGAQPAPGPAEAALAGLLKKARAELPAACSRPNPDRLIRILCDRRIRIGVRDYYPLFSSRTGERRHGYEVDVARAIAHQLGVDVEFVRVNAATRLPLLGEDRVDLVIATMGHNIQRDGQARFIRPHYYQSETTIVGLQSLPIKDWKDVAGRTVCVTIGNGSNAELVSRGARLMLFSEAGQLPERLKDETCTLAAQDDSFFANSFVDPEFARRYDYKLGFAQVPWGMAVARDNTEQLARALDLISQVFHRDGTYVDLARANHINRSFLEQQNEVWASADCDTPWGTVSNSCIQPPLDTELQPTSFAGAVSAFEAWVDAWADFDLSLPMLKTAPAWSMFKDGVANSLILITGALAATLGFAALFGAAQGSQSPLLHWPARALTITLQSSPIVLTLVIAAAIARAIFPFSDAVALGAAIVALGLANGSNAGQAIAESMTTLRAEHGAVGNLFGQALSRSATQIVAFLVNAAKGTPVASFIGAPELLSALTDITSFSSARGTTYTLLLIFYTGVVMIVVWLCGKLRRLLEQRQQVTA